MVMNPLAMLNPEQQELLQKLQKFTKDINCTVHKEGSNSFTVTLITNNLEAQQYLPQIRNSLITSLAQTLYTFFNIQGRVE